MESELGGLLAITIHSRGVSFFDVYAWLVASDLLMHCFAPFVPVDACLPVQGLLMNRILPFATASLFVLAAFGSGVARAESRNLAESWNDAGNPNGPWSFEMPGERRDGPQRVVTTQSGDVEVKESPFRERGPRLDVHSNSSELRDTAFDRSQSAWTIGGKPNVGIFLSSGLHRFDLPKGRVGGHSPFLVRWTAPRELTVSLSGGVWMPSDQGRILRVSIGVTRNLDASQVLIDSQVIPDGAAGFNSANPFAFSQIAKVVYRSDRLLREISLKRGDSLAFAVDATQGQDHFVGIDLEIDEVAAGSGEVVGERVQHGSFGTLFDKSVPSGRWTQFKAAGFETPVTGVVYRKANPATNGLALGGADTGCIDLETNRIIHLRSLMCSDQPRLSSNHSSRHVAAKYLSGHPAPVFRYPSACF
jgi:hypothetical protein